MSIRRWSALFLCLAVLVTGCAGYNFAGKQPSILGDGTKTLKVKEVTSPTLQPWLPFALRSALRDQINERHLAQWVDSGYADYEISIKVDAYTSREWMRALDGHSLLYEPTMTIEAFLYDGKTNGEVWRSGPISYAERAETTGEKKAADEIITQLMRLLADKLRNTF